MKLEPETIQRVADWVAEGRSVQWIAVTLGVGRNTLNRWIKRGQEEGYGSTYRALADAVAGARVEADAGGTPRKATLAAASATLPAYTGELTDEIRDRMLALLRQGRSLDDASGLCGVARQTPRRWIQRGIREGDGAHYEFAMMVEQAKAEGKDVYVTELENLALGRHGPEKHLPTQGRALEFLLKTRHPEFSDSMKREPREFAALVVKAVYDEATARGLPDPTGIMQGVRDRIQLYTGRAPDDDVPALAAGPGAVA